MKIEVRYLSKSGNTAKVAEAVAAAVGVSASPIGEPVAVDTELLFLGGAVYAFGIDESLTQFIAALPQTIGRVAVFSTSAIVKSAYPQIGKALADRSLTVCDEAFHCRGAFKFMHKGRPNAEDLKDAEAFAKRVSGEADV
ncbi:MAG: flavodoxin [Clostridiales Family XIII bacterium]|jgi:flavodoxin|nr:flavodoxin [Clostridiales Family XIII bacterium]